jgi:hypothetical protein
MKGMKDPEIFLTGFSLSFGMKMKVVEVKAIIFSLFLWERW